MKRTPPFADRHGQEALAWSRYWARGALHSCPDAFASGNGGGLRALWMEFFAGLQDEASVLDIGTGNGAVAFIARDAARAKGKRWRIEAIDAADIDPAAAAAAHGLSADGITFRSATPCERTGFADASFDAVSSQYALEYTAVDDTLTELARILKPGGCGLFVIHHADSRALATARAELEAFEFLQHESPIVTEARQYIRQHGGAAGRAPVGRGGSNGEARRRGRALERMLERTVRAARSKPHAGFLEAVALQANAALKEAVAGAVAAGLERLAVLEAELTAHRQRLRTMTRAAHTSEDIRRLEDAFEQAGLPAHPATEARVRGDDLIGWVLRASRR